MRQIIFFILFFCSCGQQKQQDKSLIADQPTTDSILMKVVDSNIVVQSDTNPKPTIYFLNFTDYLDSMGYNADTIRAKKVSQQLSNATIVRFGDKPFYIVNPTKHEIQSGWESLNGNYYYDSLKTNLDYNIFLKPTSIFAYYYREDKNETLIEDGIIEEWQFKTDTEATHALTELNKAVVGKMKIKDLVYFNTSSFTLQKDNYLYIFNTRAAAFHITLRKFFQTFKQRRE